MAKKVEGYIKLQIPAGKATPAPPVGPALGQHGVNIVEFTKQFNARTADKGDVLIPVVITVYSDKSFDFVLKTSPAGAQLKEILKLKSGSAEPNRKKVGTITWDQVKAIAEDKLPTHRMLFCTDDKHLGDIEREGHINYILRRAVANGIDPI